MVTVILCVFLLSYMYGEGKSNYFKGSILLLSYLVVMSRASTSMGYGAGLDNQDAGVSRFDTLGRDGEWISYGFKTIGRGGACGFFRTFLLGGGLVCVVHCCDVLLLI